MFALRELFCSYLPTPPPRPHSPTGHTHHRTWTSIPAPWAMQTLHLHPVCPAKSLRWHCILWRQAGPHHPHQPPPRVVHSTALQPPCACQWYHPQQHWMPRGVPRKHLLGGPRRTEGWVRWWTQRSSLRTSPPLGHTTTVGQDGGRFQGSSQPERSGMRPSGEKKTAELRKWSTPARWWIV